MVEQKACHALLTGRHFKFLRGAIFVDADAFPPSTSQIERLNDAACIAAEMGNIKLLEYLARTGVVDLKVET